MEEVFFQIMDIFKNLIENKGQLRKKKIELEYDVKERIIGENVDVH